MSRKTYLDYNATTPVYPDIADAMRDRLLLPSNASSVHGFGRDARKHLEDARKNIAEFISAWPNEILFTASGTEANITALRGIAGRRVAVSAVEHSSILKAVADATIIPVDEQGIVKLDTLEALLKDGMPTLVSVMLANNETGVIQPISDISAICKKHDAILHCDAVQALGKVTFDFTSLGIDMMTLSAHKCGGPVGAAALIARRDLPVAALLTGGGQELGRRAGTENLPAIIGFAMAVEKAGNHTHMQQLRSWLDELEASVEEAGGTVFGKSVARLPNTSCIAMQGVSNEVQLMDFDMKGFAVSAGSACTSGRIDVSHVLTAMGVERPLAGSAIRVSAGWQTSREDIAAFSDSWRQLQMRLKTKEKTA